MKARQAFFRGLAGSLTVLTFLFTVHRAATQAIAHDEALTYSWFLDGGVGKTLVFNANNHVLFTLLEKVFVRSFGVTELSMRAASLAGCAIYLAAAFLLCQRLFGDGVLLPMAVAALILNPTIMDFLAAGRGYGLGLSFLTAAVYFLAGITQDGSVSLEDARCRRQCIIASVLLAASVAANLSFAIPAVSVALAFFGVALLFPQQPVRRLGDNLRAFIQSFVVPGVGSGLFILWPFLIQARPQQFYAGYVRLSDSARDIFNSSFLYKWTDDPYDSLRAIPPAPNGWQAHVSNAGAFVVLPLLLLFLTCSLVGLIRRARVSPDAPLLPRSCSPGQR